MLTNVEQGKALRGMPQYAFAGQRGSHAGAASLFRLAGLFIASSPTWRRNDNGDGNMEHKQRMAWRRAKTEGTLRAVALRAPNWPARPGNDAAKPRSATGPTLATSAWAPLVLFDDAHLRRGHAAGGNDLGRHAL